MADNIMNDNAKDNNADTFIFTADVATKPEVKTR